jgi:hypothetical protein
VFRPPGCTEHPEACWVSHGPPARPGVVLMHGNIHPFAVADDYDKHLVLQAPNSRIC